MARTAAYDPIVVEPKLTPDKLRELIERRRESAKLDYKLTYSSEPEVRFRLIKHVLAMVNTAGGYIVVGAAGDGTPVGLSNDSLVELDEAKVRAQVAGASLVPIPLFVDTSASYSGHPLAVVTVLPLSARVAVCTIDAQFVRQRDKKPQFVFRKGDVLVRHGSASERWNQDDADYLLERLGAAARQRWREEFVADSAEIGRLRAERPEKADVSHRAFDKTPAEFRRLITDLLRGRNG